MTKAANLPALDLSNSTSASFFRHAGSPSAHSTDSPHSPRSPPLSPALGSYATALNMQVRPDNHASPRMGALPDTPSSPGRISPRQHSRDASKSFFSNLMASKSSHKLQSQVQPHSPEPSIAETTARSGVGSRAESKERSMHTIKKQTSTPDFPRIMAANGRQDEGQDQKPPVSADGGISNKKSKSKLGGILNRSRSGRPEDEKKLKQRPPAQLNLDIPPPLDSQSEIYAAPLKTAPIKNSFRDQIQASEGATTRNKSADRTGFSDTRSNGHIGLSQTPPSRDGGSLLASFQQTGRGVGDRLGKAGRGFFSKMTRSSSTNERELVPDEHYVCTTISLPLVKQTRKTRIAKKLESSNDKTEYWMPALPWRCIDYLNMQCEQEGLYRVPGSGRDVKFWQRRFDTEFDLNLFEEPELYDVNTIASMFKAWLRDLPEELFPRAVQAKIAKECHGAQKTPQMLKDELSRLPPFNYYLLFAITCHLSLLHSYADQNKMDYRNLCICFQPCLRIDAFCFQFLVIDWKSCWQQGCWSEKDYLVEELRHEKEGSIHDAELIVPGIDDRSRRSSNSSTHLPASTKDQHKEAPMRIFDSPSHSARVPTSSSQPLPPHQHLHQQSAPTLRPKQRSLSASGQQKSRIPSHGHAQTAPAVPRLVTVTPDHLPTAESQKLPELGSMSPIRM